MTQPTSIQIQLPISLLLSCISSVRQSSAASSAVRDAAATISSLICALSALGLRALSLLTTRADRLESKSKSFFDLRVLTAFVRHALASWLGSQSLILSLSLLSNTRSYHRCGHLNLQLIVLGSVVQVFSSSRDF